ncbi:DUF1641 domain-containing protein [Sulfobacillus harzensis]|uniref:DUF1641 domain-containing protein n=1 Tax=Sulfobacillus harzensis TaxID=2729629 RepID=A0A7Y0L373_9FIRM|nr:DUF1641 domain-containing protein [Sulfobacillus harzensis]NMP21896.1 DUF1641 domain-containing protein [Sulfobacillus harzensis]
MATIDVADETLQELTTLLAAVRDSATPGLAERISQMLVALGAVAAEVEPDRASLLVESAMQASDSLAKTLEQLDQWHRTGVWDSLAELVSLGAALKDSATPQIAERIASLAIGLGQVADEVGPGLVETVSAVERHGLVLRETIEEIARWHQDGTWETLTETVTLMRALNDSLTPHMVARTVEMVTTLGNALAEALDSGLLDFGIRLGEALAKANADASQDTTRVTAMGLVRSIKEPEMQRSVKLLMSLMRRLPAVVE